MPGSSATATQVLHAVGAAEAGVIYGRVEAIADRESRFQGDEVVYTSLGEGATSEGEFWESLNTACTGGCRCSISSKTTATRFRSRSRSRLPAATSRACCGVPRPARRRRSTARISSPACACMREAVGLRARAEGPRARARARDSAVLALAVRRREAIQDAGRSAKPKRGAIRSPGLRSSCATTAWRPPPSSNRSTAKSSAKSTRPRIEALESAPPRAEHRGGLRLSRRTWIPPPTRSSTAARARGQARHDGGRHQPDPQGRDGARRAHRRLRRGRRRRQPPRGTEARARQGRRLQGHARSPACVRRRSGVQRADCRSQHHRPRRSAWRFAG